MEMDDNKRRRNMIVYVLIAFVVYLVLSTVLFPNIGHTQQITKTDYSTFVKRLDKKSVDKVEYNTDDYTIYYTKKGEDENIAYKTTVCRMTRAYRPRDRRRCFAGVGRSR